MRGQTAAAGRKRARPASSVKSVVHRRYDSSDGDVHTDDDDDGGGGGGVHSPTPLVTPTKRAKTTPRSPIDDAATRRHQMKDAFQPWVMQTYGDAAKTKTISRRKSERIARILRGEDRSNGADSSKFRFWVRAKGFRLGPPPTPATPDAAPGGGGGDADDLYVVTSTVKDESTGEDRPVYKKVAVVEDFFDIIYREHVEFMKSGAQPTGTAAQSGGQHGSPAAGSRPPPPGKHAGQKRTYRAITEIYAFLPREAVTRFLMQCAECQRRGGGGVGNATNPMPNAVVSSPTPPLAATQLGGTQLMPPSGVSPGSPTPPASPANATPGVAATNAKPHHLPTLLLPPTPPQQQHQLQHYYHHENYYQRASTPAPVPFDLASEGVDLSLPLTSTLLKRAALAGVSHQQLLGLDRAESSFSCSTSSPPAPGMTAGRHEEAKRSTSPPSRECAMSDGPVSLNLSAKAEPDAEQSPGKDEDDEDEDDVEDRIDSQGHDPERLKAFNMFVRLFVDENLDRMVPISRQPREKVQAIIDSCVRQFPEFGERARKRIRTYLKSCRRHKRPRDPSADAATPSGGPSSSSSLAPVANRPMPPHLTSAVAEHILAQACENENQNAKRLRLGLEPVSQPMPTNAAEQRINEQQVAISTSQTSPVNLQSEAQSSTTSTTANLFRPAFGPYQRTTGPTDLSTKPRPVTSNGATPSRTSPIPHKLTPAEILAVRQLVTGYRESAAFLLRSADELEQLLQQQNASL